MKILVSACLLGENCKYNGKNNYSERVAKYLEGHEVIPVCPEVLGGLPTPRDPSEIVSGEVINCKGVNVDRQFREGAEEALRIAKENGIDLAILQSRSPSCGVKQIYDGNFTGKLIPGQGVFAQYNGKNIIVWREYTKRPGCACGSGENRCGCDGGEPQGLWTEDRNTGGNQRFS